MIVEVLGGPRDGDLLELRDNLVQVSIPEIIGIPPLDVGDGPQGLTMVERTLPIKEMAYSRVGCRVFGSDAEVPTDWYEIAVETVDGFLLKEFDPPKHAVRHDMFMGIQHDGPLMMATVQVVYIWKVAVW